MIQGIIFDMDGLMLDTESIALDSWERAGKEFGYKISRELMIKAVGRTLVDTRKLLVKNLGNDFPFEEVRKVRIDYTKEYMSLNGVPIKEGLIEFLKYCKSIKVPTAVATSTNRSDALELLKKTNIVDYFNTIVCGDEIEKGKPEPDIFLMASKKLGINPEKCIVLEDSENGILAASRANMIPIWIPDIITESDIATKNARYICNSLNEVNIIIDELNN
ncbi:HAD family hydrolase [Vallitalea sp.]|uniref:HAD family hydrolase n=1 Tax=Vallitalea sp. TaxID=1882829 RepID=UPI0025EAF159|nr:HAD family phosphatase [Vallitalea sp.]MCT4688099.1 HAD family phosphatase [Vallitalea sp.]